MKKAILITMLIGSIATAYASEKETVAKKWDEDSWEAALAKMPDGSVKRGEALEKKGYCYTCHGDKGIARTNNAPSLAGIKNTWLYKAMLDYKSGLYHLDNKSYVMEAVVAPMTNQDMSDLAVYYAAQKRPVGAGKVKPPHKAKKCGKCHDSGDEDDGPSLKGQSTLFLTRQLYAYKHKVRHTATGNSMKKASKKLKKKQIKELADYYADQ